MIGEAVSHDGRKEVVGQGEGMSIGPVHRNVGAIELRVGHIDSTLNRTLYAREAIQAATVQSQFSGCYVVLDVEIQHGRLVSQRVPLGVQTNERGGSTRSRKPSKHAVEGTILLDHEDDVLNNPAAHSLA